MCFVVERKRALWPMSTSSNCKLKHIGVRLRVTLITITHSKLNCNGFWEHSIGELYKTAMAGGDLS
jgi:hypothetical protein